MNKARYSVVIFVSIWIVQIAIIYFTIEMFDGASMDSPSGELLRGIVYIIELPVSTITGLLYGKGLYAIIQSPGLYLAICSFLNAILITSIIILLTYRFTENGKENHVPKDIYSNADQVIDLPTATEYKYVVYSNPVLGYEAIKNGFSFPAFFFTWIWAFYKKLWVQGVILLTLSVLSSLLGTTIGKIGFSIIPLLIIELVAGYKGNDWKLRSMASLGFRVVGYSMATTAEAALSEIKEREDTVVPSKKEDTKTCPYCAETIKEKAKVCRYCGKDLE